MNIPPIPAYRKPKKQPLGKNTKIKPCEWCGGDMIVPPCRQKENVRGQGEQRFCSQNCYDAARQAKGNIKTTCKGCGKEILFNKHKASSRTHVCSRECLELYKASKVKVKVLDDYWSEIIKFRAGRKCEYCGSTKKLNSHHIYSRGIWSVRWDLDNGICLCVRHHLLGAESAHKSPLLFAEWIKDQRGELWHKRLLEKVRAKGKPNRAWEYFHLLSWIDKFKNMDNPENYDINDWDWDITPRSSVIECPEIEELHASTISD